MKAFIDRENCIACGLCEQTCPEVFAMAEDGLAKVIADNVPAALIDLAVAAAESCPTSIITVE